MRNQRGEMQLYRKYIASMSQMYNQREDIRMFVELILTLTAIFVFTVFAIRPTLKTIGSLNQEINTKDDTIRTMDEKIANIQIAQQVYSDSSESLPLLLQAMPNNPDFISFIRQIELAASKTSVKISQFNFQNIPLKGDSSITPGKGSLQYSLTLQGSFAQLSEFVVQLESLRRGTVFQSSLIKVSDDLSFGAISYTVNGEISFLTSKTQ